MEKTCKDYFQNGVQQPDSIKTKKIVYHKEYSTEIIRRDIPKVEKENKERIPKDGKRGGGMLRGIRKRAIHTNNIEGAGMTNIARLEDKVAYADTSSRRLKFRDRIQ